MRTASSKWVEFEDTPTLGRFQRTVEIDPIDGANEPDTERYASRERAEDVAKELNSLCRVQLGRTYFFFPAAHGDGRAAGSAQIPHPLDFAPGAQTQRLPETSMIATGVVRGRPLFRPRMVMSPLKPIGTPAANRNLTIGLNNEKTHRGGTPGTPAALPIRSLIW
jgi:hypothetical protein